jgi:exodeoxyribonuclease VII small subunit
MELNMAEPLTAGAPDSELLASEELGARTFEELVGELEAVARQMESSELGIEAATDLYGRAAALHTAATERLTRVQQRLAELRGDNPR